ncbi:MAG: hypothetical protein MMC23_000741 [Stictis urceolatum]|nr:hypothetical protein [Stictis urceolata]
MAPLRISTLLALITIVPLAITRSILPAQQVPFGDDCTVVSRPGGGKIITCPGCTRIIDKDGNTIVRTGPNCPKDSSALPSSTSPQDPYDPSLCASLTLPNGDTITSCPTCQRIHDPAHQTILQSGPDCEKFTHAVPSQSGIDTRSVERCAALGPGLETDGGETLLDCLGCRKFVDASRRTHVECPGCHKILSEEGRVLLEYGHKCGEYESDLPVFGGRGWKDAGGSEDLEVESKDKEPDYDGCTVVRRSGDKGVVVCLGCVIVYDGEGNETVRTGWKCKDYEMGMASWQKHEPIWVHEEDLFTDNLEAEEATPQVHGNLEL